jgi:ketosteroid isomerase-like protein
MTVEANTATPHGLMKLFSQRAEDGDISGLMDLYEEGAVFQPEFGVALSGHSQIRPASEEFLALSPRITYTTDPDVIIAGDIALVSNFWTMVATLPDGTVMNEGGTSADVLRRQADGTWKVLVDQPRGESIAA